MQGHPHGPDHAHPHSNGDPSAPLGRALVAVPDRGLAASLSSALLAAGLLPIAATKQEVFIWVHADQFVVLVIHTRLGSPNSWRRYAAAATPQYSASARWQPTAGPYPPASPPTTRSPTTSTPACSPPTASPCWPDAGRFHPLTRPSWSRGDRCASTSRDGRPSGTTPPCPSPRPSSTSSSS